MSITEAAIRGLTTAQSFERGEEYYHNGAVYNLQKRGHQLIAEVEGSSYEPYNVTIDLSGDEIISTWCTCPYDWGGDCKHIIAVLLTYLRDPDQVTERRSVEEMLSGLGSEELRALLIDLLNSEPHLIDRLEAKITTQTGVKSQSSADQSAGDSETIEDNTTPPPIDPGAFRRQARQIMRIPNRWDYYVSSGVAGQMSGLLDQVSPFLEAGDGRNALLALEAVAEPYLEDWVDFDDSDGELGALFSEIGALFAEALLSAEFSPAERKSWADKLTAWQGEIDDYGIDDAFDVAIAAAEQGWDYAPLQKVLRDGQITEQGAWMGEAPWFADDLAVIRLNVLARQGRTTEYLYLAEAEGQTALYLTMLVKLGRIQEAVAYALQYMATSGEALATAEALAEHDQPVEAIKIAGHGLKFEDHTKLSLACWLRDFAVEKSREDVALKAGAAAFDKSYSLEDYQAIKTIAGDEWSSLKPTLLAKLASKKTAYGREDIYLYEGMIDEAISVIDGQPYAGYGQVEKVVDAAWQSHPDWVIRQCKAQAESIMDAGKSDRYHHAVRWLEKARKAYLAAERQAEWRTYLEGLISKHNRKYSLRPRLEDLRSGGK